MPFELRKTPAFQVALAGEKLNGAGREGGGGGGGGGGERQVKMRGAAGQPD